MTNKVNDSWLSIVVPVSALSSGLGVLVPLMILSLHGTVMDVSFAVALYTLVGIPASLIWGKLTDEVMNLRLFILLSILGVFPELLIMYFLLSSAAITVSYAFYSFIATAASPSINLLVIGKRRTSSLPSYFSLYSILVIVGGIIGMLPGLFTDSQYLWAYLLFLMFLNALSFIFSMIFIPKRMNFVAKKAENRRIGRSFSLLNMLTPHPFLSTSHRLIDKLSFIVRHKHERTIYLLLLTIGLFTIGIYVFNTSYIPFLYHYGLTYADIFFINMINFVGQVVVYVSLIKYRKALLGLYYRVSTLLRGFSYLVAFIPIFIFSSYFFTINILAYLIAGFAYALWNVSSSVILYSFIRGRHAANYIGIWTAVLGTAGVVGALLSGIISSYGNYILTFSLGILMSILSFLTFSESRFIPTRTKKA